MYNENKNNNDIKEPDHFDVFNDGVAIQGF
jgi:hypothetical protein